MITKLTNDVIFVPSIPFTIERLPSLKSTIEKNWDKFIYENKDKAIFNGDVIYVTNVEVKNNTFFLDIAIGKYADMVYAKTSGKIITHSLFVASYLKTSDNQIGLVVDNGNRLNTIGGMADVADIIDGSFRPEKCLARELWEELGIDIHDKSIINSFSAKYLKHADESQEKAPVFPIGVLYEITSCLSKTQLELLLSQKKCNVTEKGIRPIFIQEAKMSEITLYTNRVGYIDDLFKLIAEDRKHGITQAMS